MSVAEQRINVDEQLNRSPVGHFHALVVALCGMVVLIDGYDLVVMGLVIPTMSEAWAVEPSVFAPALSAALIGVLFGSSLAGMAADSFGRRWTMVVLLLVASAFMLLSARAESLIELTAYRFMTGFGAGGTIPLAIAFTSEYMPERKRNMLVILMYAGAPMGSVVGGFIAPWMIANYGWQGIFVLGGILPLAAALAVALLLPESVRLLVSRGCDHGVAARLLQRVNPQFRLEPGQRFFVPEQEAKRKLAGIRELFGGRKTLVTAIVWVVFFANQSIIFLFALWLPTLFSESNVPLGVALYAYALYKLGGAVGGVGFGVLSDRVEPANVLRVTYPIAAVLVAVLGLTTFSVPLLAVTAVVTGICVGGSSLCLGSMTAGLYPVYARATGVGWALGVGRLGSIISPLLGGAAIAADLSMPVILLVSASAPVICALGVWLLPALTTENRTASA